MRIEFIGAQGTGKTTIVNLLKEYGIPIIDGVVRDLVNTYNIPINEKGSANSQETIFRCYKNIFENKYADYISTRSLFDVVAYTQYLYLKSGDDHDLRDEVLTQVQELRDYLSFNKDVIYIYFPIEFELEGDGVRSVNKEYQKEIDHIITNLLKSTKVKYYTIHGSVEERMKFVEKIIEDFESKKKKRSRK